MQTYFMQTFDEIFDYVDNIGSDNIDMFGGKYVGGYYLQQVPEEAAQLIETLLKLNNNWENLLEVGAAAGGLSRILNDFFYFKNIYIIDDNQHSKHIHRKNNLPNCIEFIGNSHSEQCMEKLKNWNKQFDFIIIDGDHSYEGVKQDLELVLPYCSGYIMFHDSVYCEGVKNFVSTLETNYLNLSIQKQIYKKLGICLIKKTNAKC